MIYDGLVYVAVGQDPEHGEGIGHLWCIDPTKRGDVSPELAFNAADPEPADPPQAHPGRRARRGRPRRGPIPIRPSIWHYSEFDQNGDGEIDFEETMHRSCGTVAIKDDLLYIADFSGLFHCLDAKTGKVHWTYDMLAAAWGSPLIVDDKVYIGDEDGDIAIFRHSADPDVAMREDDGEWDPSTANSTWATASTARRSSPTTCSTSATAPTCLPLLLKNRKIGLNRRKRRKYQQQRADAVWKTPFSRRPLCLTF